MSQSFKPTGYNSVSPYLIVKDAPRLISLLATIFDATPLRRYDRPDGTIMHAEIRIDDSVLMFSEATADYPPNENLLHIYVPDASATYEKALAAGCTGLQDPVQKDDPDLRGMFQDFANNIWTIGTQTLVD